ncbi:MAG: L,D-transpeptidase [Sciscionella sp.]
MTARRWLFALIAAVALLAGLSVWVMVGVAIGGGSTTHPSQAAAANPAPQADVKPARQAAESPAITTGRAPSLVTNDCPAKAVACVDTRLRLAWLQHDGKPFYGPVPIMPGTAGANDSVATPLGVFHVQWKDAHHVSSEFGEPMANAVFFAPGGIAFHEGSLVSSSHGCVHLSHSASAYFFQHLPRGAEVAVFQ